MSIGIYNDNFLSFLESNLGSIKTNPKNIIVPCPWCDINKPNRTKNRLWIAIDAPMFHCFRAGCEKSGSTWSLIKALSGNGDVYIDKEKIKEFVKQKVDFTRNTVKKIEVQYPELKTEIFKYKELYLKNRFKHSINSLNNIKGLVFDILEFIRINNITIDPQLFRLQEYLQTNFVGFVSENQSVMVLRNVDENATFRYFKMRIQPTKFLDYFKLSGYKKNSNIIILAEGVFDIYGEYIFDSINMRNKCSLYACGLSTSYPALIKSITYHEQIFRPDIHILSDRNVELRYYKSIKKYNSHLIGSMNVYYNKAGHDFNDTPLVIEKFII